MARFYGTAGDDQILRSGISAGVISDPIGFTNTAGDIRHTIFAGAGDDVAELGDREGYIDGGDGNDRLYGSPYSDLIYGRAGDDVLYGGNAVGLEILDGGSGADRMTGGSGQHIYVVDDRRDVARDFGVWPDDAWDTIVTNLDLTLSETANIEGVDLTLAGAYGMAARATTIVGNSSNNILTGNDLGNMLHGRDGRDILTGNGGDDRLNGGHGDDVLTGGAGRDVLRGGEGNDFFEDAVGGGDRLFGGAGDDIFMFRNNPSAWEPGADTIAARGGPAFDGVGDAAGDVISLPEEIRPAFDETDIGRVELVNVGTRTLIRANLDDDPDYEFRLYIEDGQSVRASDYTGQDFGLYL